MLKKLIPLSYVFILVFSSIFADTPIPKQGDDTLFPKIFEEHLHSFPYRNECKQKLIVMFSGTPGMGKSTVAKRLEEHFHGMRVSSDEVRKLLKKHQIYDESTVKRYVVWTIEKLMTCYLNQLIIVDGSVDRTYDIYIKMIKGKGIDTFLIRMQLDRQTLEKRIRERGISVEPILRHMDLYWKDYETFGQNHEPDFIFNNSDNVECALNKLVECIACKLASA